MTTNIINNNLICFRADGNATLGSGHIMRCLSIAKAFRNLSYNCIFVGADTTMKEVVIQNDFSFYSLDSTWNNLGVETKSLENFLDQYSPALLIIDSYYVTKHYLSVLKAKVTTIYLDDLHAFDYPVDGLINYNIFSKHIDYSYLKTHFLGLDYAPLRKEFSNLTPRAITKMKDILILTGGSDSENCALRLLHFFRTLPSFTKFQLHFVLGSLYPHLEEMQLQTKTLDNVHLHQNVTKMSTLMQQCDFAISASGSTLYELCACGTPAVIYSLADNQLEIADVFSKEGYMPYIGDLRLSGDSDEAFHTLAEIMDEYTNDTTKLQTISDKMRALVDGNGAMRLASSLIKTFLST